MAPAPPLLAGAAYVPCPGGLFRCGELKDPAGRCGPGNPMPKCTASVTANCCIQGIEVKCKRSEIQTIEDDIRKWKRRVNQIYNAQKAVADQISALGDAYGSYAPKRDYLKGVADSIYNGLLAGFIKPLLDEMTFSERCIWDPKYQQGGCYYIPTDCFDRSYYEPKLRDWFPQMERYARELINDLQANRGMLIGGLPSGCLRTNSAGQCIQSCDAGTVPCRQHMNGALNIIIDNERIVLDLSRPDDI